MDSIAILSGAHLDRLREVLRQYDIGTILEISLLGGGTANRNFLVRTGRESLGLRERSPKYSNEDSATYEQAFLNHEPPFIRARWIYSRVQAT